MLKTFYMDHQAVMAIALEYQAAEACAALDDLGLTLCSSRREFEQLAASDIFLGGGEVGAEYGMTFFAVVHRRSSVLPETPPPDPMPQFNPATRRLRGEWWRRSREFRRHAAKFGWPAWYILNGPLEQFLKKHFHVPVPWFLSDSQYAEAWRAVAWGPSANSMGL